MTVAVRKLDQGLPRVDMRSPALVARQRGAAPETVDGTLRMVRRMLDEARRDREAAASVLAEAHVQAAAIITETEVLIRQKISLPPLPSVIDIIKAVGERHGFTLRAMLGRGQSRALAAARREAIALAHAARPDLNPSHLGRIFRRDRSTILHALAVARGDKSRGWQ